MAYNRNYRSFLLLLFLITVPAFAQNPIPNFGFENWSNGDPDGWNTSNSPGAFANIENTGDVHSGSGAVKGEVISFMSLPISPTLASGNVSDGFFPITERYASLTGFYEFLPLGADILVINAVVVDAMDATIGLGTTTLTQAAADYTQFTMPITYFATGDAALAAILVTITNGVTGLGTPGTIFRLDDLEFSNSTTGVEPVEDGTIAAEFNLEQNYPNPFNPATTIEFSTTRSVFVKLTIFNQLGQKIETLVSETLAAGNYKSEWQPENVAGGIYFYQLEAGNNVQTRKLILLK